MEIVAASGRLQALAPLWDAAQARAAGCAEVLIAGRPGWKRVLPGLEGPAGLSLENLVITPSRRRVERERAARKE